ncbi:MAG: 50S ribosomal protein L21 [Anaerolineae bacterium]|jgi:large subunit ribosomal protein L21
MYAVVKTGGKQYRVSPGDSIEVEKLPHEVGEQVELEEVLLVANGSRTKIGRPVVKGAKVKATVTRQAKGRKVIIFKYRSSKRYRRHKGHRQHLTRLRIDEIVA